MKPLVSTAVLGLIPVPSLPVACDAARTAACRAVSAEDGGAWELAPSAPHAAERLATPDELARLQEELEAQYLA
jgi:hypothetical protein